MEQRFLLVLTFLLLLFEKNLPSISALKVAGDPCTKQNECANSQTHMACENGRCDCLFGQFFDKIRLICVSGVGAKCTLPRSPLKPPFKCVENAQCTEDGKSNGGPGWGLCECEKGYSRSNENLCLSRTIMANLYGGGSGSSSINHHIGYSITGMKLINFTSLIITYIFSRYI